MAVALSLLVWFAIYLLIVFLTGWLFRTVGAEKIARRVFFPGFICVTIVRLVAGAVTGVKEDPDGKVTRKKKGDDGGGEPGIKTKIAFSFLPFLTCTVLLVALFAVPEKLPVPVHAQIDEELTLDQDGLVAFFGTAAGLVWVVLAAIGSNPDSWQVWASLYAAAALIVAGAPRASDLKLIAPMVGGTILSIWGLEALGVGAGFFPQAWVASWFAGQSTQQALAFVLCLALFTFVICAAVLGAGHILARMSDRRRQKST